MSSIYVIKKVEETEDSATSLFRLNYIKETDLLGQVPNLRDVKKEKLNRLVSIQVSHDIDTEFTIQRGCGHFIWRLY